jgi:hypothetical protein
MALCLSSARESSMFSRIHETLRDRAVSGIMLGNWAKMEHLLRRGWRQEHIPHQLLGGPPEVLLPMQLRKFDVAGVRLFRRYDRPVEYASHDDEMPPTSMPIPCWASDDGKMLRYTILNTHQVTLPPGLTLPDNVFLRRTEAQVRHANEAQETYYLNWSRDNIFDGALTRAKIARVLGWRTSGQTNLDHIHTRPLSIQEANALYVDLFA